VPSESTGAIADRYAHALYDLALQSGSLDAVAGDLKSLKGFLAESLELRQLIHSPVLSRGAQQGAVIALAQSAGFQELSVKFLGLVAKNRRLGALPGIVESFLGRLAASRGEVTAQVSSAVALDDAQLGALVASLKQAVGANVSLDVTIDPSLLGGLVVKVGSRMVDSSLKTKLQHLQLAMKGVG